MSPSRSVLKRHLAQAGAKRHLRTLGDDADIERLLEIVQRLAEGCRSQVLAAVRAEGQACAEIAETVAAELQGPIEDEQLSPKNRAEAERLQRVAGMIASRIRRRAR